MPTPANFLSRALPKGNPDPHEAAEGGDGGRNAAVAVFILRHVKSVLQMHHTYSLLRPPKMDVPVNAF